MADHRTLLYHRVAELPRGTVHKGTVSRRRFEQQLRWARWLGRSFCPHGRPENLPPRKLSVTFDDGYCDLLDHAVPLLLQYQIPATFYVVSESRRDHWNQWEDQDSHALFEPNHWRELSNLGFQIGSHTLDHPRLTECSDAELGRQLVESKAQIEDAIGCPVTSLAYPWGAHDDRVVDGARRAGYENACTVERRAVVAADDPLRMPRIPVGHRTGLRKWLFRTLRG
ncbi:MAG: polysaccharide deacetylase family protein [Planctomycetota bacterium]